MSTTPTQAPAPSIEFACTSCHRTLKVAARAAGKRAACPQCGATVQVPAASTTAAPSAAVGPAPLPSLSLTGSAATQSAPSLPLPPMPQPALGGTLPPLPQTFAQQPMSYAPQPAAPGSMPTPQVVPPAPPKAPSVPKY